MTALQTRMCFVDSFPIDCISLSTQLNWFLLISLVDNYVKIRKAQLLLLSEFLASHLNYSRMQAPLNRNLEVHLFPFLLKLFYLLLKLR